jgi:hypothetical protein
VLALLLVETEFPFLIASHLPRWIELTSFAGPRTAFLASIFSREASTRSKVRWAPRWICIVAATNKSLARSNKSRTCSTERKNGDPADKGNRAQQQGEA